MLKDAMGYLIEIGSIYGYSIRKNGIVTVVIGKAIELNEESKKVKLEVLKKGKGVYENEIKSYTYNNRYSLVISNTLFKLNNSTTNWD